MTADMRGECHPRVPDRAGHLPRPDLLATRSALWYQVEQILRYLSQLLNLSWGAWERVVVSSVCFRELYFDIQKRKTKPKEVPWGRGYGCFQNACSYKCAVRKATRHTKTTLQAPTPRKDLGSSASFCIKHSIHCCQHVWTAACFP